jgi:hypothetical protein
MICYFTKPFQAVPALMSIYREIGGQFVSTRANTIQAIREINSEVVISKYIEKLGNFSTGYRQLKNAQVIVTGGPYANLLKRFDAKKYMIFTGTTPSLTAKQIRDDHAHFDKLCAIGPRMMRTIERSEVKVDAVLAGYFPFLAFPEKSQIVKQLLIKQAGLINDKKLLVYLPRGEPFGSFDLIMPKLLEAVSSGNYNLIVRPHPSQSVKLHLRDRIKFMRLKKTISLTHNVFLDLNNLRLADLLASADLVITDGNSPAEESLFYDTPQILVESLRLSRASISQSMKQQGASMEDIELALRIYDNGPLLTPAESNLLNVVDRALADADQYANARQANFEFVFGKRTFERQYAVIDELRQYAT